MISHICDIERAQKVYDCAVIFAFFGIYTVAGLGNAVGKALDDIQSGHILP